MHIYIWDRKKVCLLGLIYQVVFKHVSTDSLAGYSKTCGFHIFTTRMSCLVNKNKQLNWWHQLKNLRWFIIRLGIKQYVVSTMSMKCFHFCKDKTGVACGKTTRGVPTCYTGQRARNAAHINNWRHLPRLLLWMLHRSKESKLRFSALLIGLSSSGSRIWLRGGPNFF